MASPLVGELKTYLVRMVVGVVALDAVAIGLYYGLHVANAAPRTQTVFTVAWTALTLAVVLVGLGKIRAARLRSRRTPSGTGRGTGPRPAG